MSETPKYKVSDRTLSYKIAQKNFTSDRALIDNMKSTMDSGLSFFECIKWDKEKQIGSFKALFILEYEDSVRTVKNIPNASHIKYDLVGGEICLLGKIFQDRDSQLLKTPLSSNNWEGFDDLVLLSVYSDCYFSVKKESVELIFDKTGLTIKGGSLQVEKDITSDSGDITATQGDVKAGSISLKNHIHSAGSLADINGKVEGETGGAV